MADKSMNDLAALLSNNGAESNELIDKLRGLLGLPNSGRSPAFKPLKDLRAPTTAKGRLNRPHFEWSADDDGSTVIAPFPRLYWDQNGIERRIESADDFDRSDRTGWTSAPPMAHALSPSERAMAELALLSAEDRQFVLNAQKTTRLDRIRETLSGLSQADIAAIMAANAPVAEAPAAPAEAKGKKTA